MRFLLLLFFNYRQQNDQLPFNSFLKTHSLFVLHFPQALCYQRSSQSVFIVCLHAAHWIHLEYDIHFPFPWDSLVAQRVKHLPTTWETQVRSLGQKIPWRRKWQPTPVLLSRKFHGWRRLVGYIPWGCKELDMTEQLYLFPFLLYPSLLSVWSSIGHQKHLEFIY